MRLSSCDVDVALTKCNAPTDLHSYVKAARVFFIVWLIFGITRPCKARESLLALRPSSHRKQRGHATELDLKWTELRVQ
jgi:hypothetical protein